MIVTPQSRETGSAALRLSGFPHLIFRRSASTDRRRGRPQDDRRSPGFARLAILTAPMG